MLRLVVNIVVAVAAIAQVRTVYIDIIVAKCIYFIGTIAVRFAQLVVAAESLDLIEDLVVS